jgi:SpoVK/Ycf46/Vps4 family AAA+-type ATPase
LACCHPPNSWKQPGDLIGGYIGQTAIKVVEVVEKARGGVLFIDEAYALMPRHESDFAHEALSTLVQKMEDLRDELVVIMAGYRNEMQQMIDVNPGLRSRMNTYIDFPRLHAHRTQRDFLCDCGALWSDSHR